MLFENMNNFKLKTIKVQHTQEKLFTFSITTYKNLGRRPIPGRELILNIPFISEIFTGMAW